MKLRTSSTSPSVNCSRLLCSQPYWSAPQESPGLSSLRAIWPRVIRAGRQEHNQLASSAGAAAENCAHRSEWHRRANPSFLQPRRFAWLGSSPRLHPGALSGVKSLFGWKEVYLRAHTAARSRSNSRSRAFCVCVAARSNSARASVKRPSLNRKSPRTLGKR